MPLKPSTNKVNILKLTIRAFTKYLRAMCALYLDTFTKPFHSFIHPIPLPVNGQSGLNVDNVAYTSNKLHLKIKEKDEQIGMLSAVVVFARLRTRRCVNNFSNGS